MSEVRIVLWKNSYAWKLCECGREEEVWLSVDGKIWKEQIWKKYRNGKKKKKKRKINHEMKFPRLSWMPKAEHFLA